MAPAPRANPTSYFSGLFLLPDLHRWYCTRIRILPFIGAYVLELQARVSRHEYPYPYLHQDIIMRAPRPHRQSWRPPVSHFWFAISRCWRSSRDLHASNLSLCWRTPTLKGWRGWFPSSHPAFSGRPRQKRDFKFSFSLHIDRCNGVKSIILMSIRLNFSIWRPPGVSIRRDGGGLAGALPHILWVVDPHSSAAWVCSHVARLSAATSLLRGRPQGETPWRDPRARYPRQSKPNECLI